MNIDDFNIGDTLCAFCGKPGGHSTRCPNFLELMYGNILSLREIHEGIEKYNNPLEGEYEDITNKKDIPRLESSTNGN